MSVQEPLIGSTVYGTSTVYSTAVDVKGARPKVGAVMDTDPNFIQNGYIKSAVYGGLDGIITTFSTVTTVTGANLPQYVIIVLGLAHLVADGLSMGIGDVLSTQSENELARNERRRETWEFDDHPESEIGEMIEFYEAKGIERTDAELVIKTLAKYREAFVDIMMIEQLNIVNPQTDREARVGGLVTFCSFMLFGCVPLLPHVLALIPGMTMSGYHQFVASTILAIVTMFALGAIKSRAVGAQRWYWSGFVMSVLGSLAAVVGYIIGFLFYQSSIEAGMH